MNNRPPRDPPSLARQYPSLESLAIPQALKTAVRHAYQHIYDLRDEVLQLEALQGEAGASGLSTSVFHYRADTTSTTASDPGAGKIRWNNSTQSSATFLYFDWLTDDKFDVTVLWQLMNAPDQFIIQDRDLAINHQIWQMTGPVVMMPDWFQVPVSFVSSSGAGVFSNNQQISVLIPVTSGGGGGGGGTVTAVTGVSPIASSGGTAPAISIATFTGDSGSGGARGAVPAPAAGDGAAGKVLGAGGGWVVGSGGGTGGTPAYLSSLFVGPDTTRTIAGATHGYVTAGLLVQVYDNASPRNAIVAGWTVNSTTYDVIITFAVPQSNYYVVINGATGMQGPPGSGGGSGTVTSVALTVPAEFSVSGSPVTTSGTLAVSKATQSANTVYAGPTTGSAAAPTFRSVVPADLPLASSSAFGAVKVDGTTITAASGVISAAGGSSGALVLLEQHTASSSASLVFTTCITSSYDVYQIEIVRLVPASAGSLYLRCSTDGGATYDSGANYGWDDYRIGPGGAAAGGANSGQPQISLSGSTETIQTSATIGGFNGSFKLFDPLSTAGYKGLHGQTNFYSNLPTMVTNVLSGRYISTTAVNALQFLMSSGNIASGIIRIYGLAK